MQQKKKQACTTLHSKKLESTKANFTQEEKEQKTNDTKELKALKVKHLTEIEALKARHNSALEKLKTNHANEIKTQKTEHEYNLKMLKEMLSQQYDTVNNNHLTTLESRNINHNREVLEFSAIKPSVIANLKPFSKIAIEPEIAYILEDLIEAGIELYITGGAVRDPLLGIPQSANQDIDVIANCTPEEFLAKFKRKATQNFLEPKQITFGKIDFRCEPWDNLRLSLDKRDLTINTFICNPLTGEVYDLLGYQEDLKSDYLHLIGDLNKRLVADPSLILRILRFSTQLDKDIDPEQLIVIQEYAPLIKELDIGILLKNLEKLFLNPMPCVHFNKIMHLNMLQHILHTLSIDLIQAMYIQRPLLISFWLQKLQIYASDPQAGYYHILSLFLLLPILMQSKKPKLHDRIQECVDQYIATYEGKFNDGQEKLRRSVFSIIQKSKDTDGLYAEFITFESYWLNMQNRANDIDINITPTFTPGFNINMTANTHQMDSIVKAPTSSCKNNSF